MPFELPPLPYAYNALEPTIDEETMHLHHDKHHQAYVTNLNNALQGQDALANLSIEDLVRRINEVPENIRTAVRNNGGGHANHTMFWEIMTPGGGKRADGRPRQRHQPGLRLVRRLQEAVQRRRHEALRLRLGVAGRRQGGKLADHFDRQPGQPADGWAVSDPGQRRVGACLLPQVSEPPPGLSGRVVECRQLGRGRQALRARAGAVVSRSVSCSGGGFFMNPPSPYHTSSGTSSRH